MTKSKALAVASFVFGLTFWIPLLNVIFGVLAIVLGVKAIRAVRRDPEHHGGFVLALIGIILGAMPIVFSLAGLALCLSGLTDICVNMGLWFLA